VRPAGGCRADCAVEVPRIHHQQLGVGEPPPSALGDPDRCAQRRQFLRGQFQLRGLRRIGDRLRTRGARNGDHGVGQR